MGDRVEFQSTAAPAVTTPSLPSSYYDAAADRTACQKRYPGVIGDNRNEYGPNDLPTLLQWQRENPPTEYEKHRNQYIEKLQGNRNPLIDFPQWADKIDFTRGLGKFGR